MEEIRVHRITKSGFGSSPGQIPSDLKVPLMVFDYLNEEAAKKAKTKSKYLTEQLKTIKNKKTNWSFRCSRSGFVPFDVLGRLLPSARADGVPQVGPEVVLDKEGNLIKSPLYLALIMKDGFIAAFAALYTQADGTLKLEYLCGAPKFKGAGSALLHLMKEGQIFKTVVKGIKRLYLNNNSQIPGYYEKKGFIKAGKTKPGQYMMKDQNGVLDKNTGEIRLVDKILNIYKASMMPSKVKPVKPVKPVKSVSKKPLPTRVIRTRRRPLSPPKTLHQLRKRTIFQF